MCGVLGYYALGTARPNWGRLYYAWDWLKARGTDGCGFVYPSTEGQAVVVKSALPSDKFIRSPEATTTLRALEATAPPYLLMHVRKTTVQSKVAIEHAHPFSGGDVAIIHNGRIGNADELMRQMKLPLPVIDSESIPHLFDTHAIWEGPEKFVRALEELRGEFTIAGITLQDNKVYLATNGGRPLDLAYDDQAQIVYFCSDWAYLDDIFFEGSSEEVAIGKATFKRSKSVPRTVEPLLLHVKGCQWLIISPPSEENGTDWLQSGTFQEKKLVVDYTRYPANRASQAAKTPDTSPVPPKTENWPNLLKTGTARITKFLDFIGLTA